MKTKFRKIMSIIVSSVMIMIIFIPQSTMKTYATCCRKNGFDKSRYTLTGNMAEDVATIAKSQKGRFCGDFGYTGVDWGEWCDEFVADCIENAGGNSTIVVHGGTVADFANKMMQRGAMRVTTPQTGDLVFFTYSHVEIVTKVVNGVVYSAGGNNKDPNTNTYHDGGCCAGEHRTSNISYYLRPNYVNTNKKWHETMSPANLGDNFTAYIINTSAWKLLTNESDNNVDMKSEVKTAEQTWQFTRKSDGSYKIINCKTGLALDSGGTSGNLYTFTDCDNDYQSWYIYEEYGSYCLRAKAGDEVIDIVGGSTDDGTNAQMYEHNCTTAQQFTIWKIDNGANLGVVQNLGDCFTAYIINTDAWKLLTNEPDNNVVIRTEVKMAEQMWQFTRKGDGSYKIINCKTGLALDSGGTDENLYTFTDCDNSYQNWYIFGDEGSYFLTSQATNSVIDIVGASTENGANAQLYECNGTTAQKFSIWKLSDGTNFGTMQNLGDSFTTYIANINGGKMLTAEEDNNVAQRSSSKTADQMWQFTRKDDGSYKIINCKTGLALDSGGENDNLYTFTDCDNAYQSWYIFGNEGSYMLTSQATNGVIDIVGGSPDDGVNAQLYECNGTVAQIFEILKIDTGANLGKIQDIGSDFYAELGDGKNLFSDSRDGLSIKLKESSSNQLWHFTRLNDGSYKIINCWSGKALDSGGTDNSVYTYTDCDNAYQSWYIFGERDKYYLKSKAFDTVITITDNISIMDKCNGSVSQQLSIKVLDIPVIEGDANLDGEVNVADAVILQKWLLCCGSLDCWQNVDLCCDKRIDVFDLVMLKRMLIADMV